jgi:hypothetical protein
LEEKDHEGVNMEFERLSNQSIRRAIEVRRVLSFFNPFVLFVLFVLFVVKNHYLHQPC